MKTKLEKLKLGNRAVPCLFYPIAKKEQLSMSDVLADAEKQGQLLLTIAESYAVGAVVRMTELWCEAAACGMTCHIADNTFPQLGDPLYMDVHELENASFPQARNQITSPLIDAASQAVPHMDKPLIVGATGPYTLGSVVNGSENFMINCMTEPEIVHAYLEKVTAFLIDYIAAYKAAGVSAILLAEPSTAMVSPDMMEEFSSRYVQKIVQRLQDETFSIIYHNCRSVNGHLETIAKLDVDAFHFGSDVDLGKAAGCIGSGKLVMGNIDPR
ncbi:MAG: hypothetical protein HY770_02500, partial [Chitinivibrionia bacterium]|nr:hypothetical protein [Chitinivibrionia bacterium]